MLVKAGHRNQLSALKEGKVVTEYIAELSITIDNMWRVYTLEYWSVLGTPSFDQKDFKSCTLAVAIYW